MNTKLLLNLENSNNLNFGYGDFTIDFRISKKEGKKEMKDHPFIKKIKCHHCNGTGKVKKDKLCIRCRGIGYWLKSLDEKIVSVCKSCHGTGLTNSLLDDICSKCNGNAYTDWLEKIIPREKKWRQQNIGSKNKLNGTWQIITEPTMQTLFDPSMMLEIAKDLSEQIDNEILNSYINSYKSLEQI